MKDFDYTKLKRNPNAIKSKLKTSDNIVIAKETLYVMFPEKYVDKELAILGNTCHVTGVICIFDDKNNYSIMTVPAKLEMQPVEIDTVLVENEPYVVLTFMENSDLISNTKVVKDITGTFPVFDLFLIQGKIPWYIGYTDLLNVFANMGKYTGTKATNNLLTFEILIATIARDEKDRLKDFRLSLKDMKDMEKKRPVWVGMNDIFYSFRSTLAKIAGSYMKLGVVSSIINPEKKANELENIVRT